MQRDAHQVRKSQTYPEGEGRGRWLCREKMGCPMIHFPSQLTECVRGSNFQLPPLVYMLHGSLGMISLCRFHFTNRRCSNRRL